MMSIQNISQAIQTTIIFTSNMIHNLPASHLKVKINLILLSSMLYVPLMFAGNADSLTIEQYVEKRYLTNDVVYGKKPKNKFGSIGSAYVKTICAADIFNDCGVLDNNIVKNISTLLLNNDQIKYYEYISTPEGDFIFYRLNTPVENEKNKTYFMNGFAFLKDNKLSVIGQTITKEDIDVGGYTRELWDIIKHKGTIYILFYHTHYESHSFEIFVVKNNTVHPFTLFEFGGL